MNALFPFTTDSTLEDFLADLEAELEVPESRYEAAERSYHSVGDWLHRLGSRVSAYDPQVYVQGSFRLGTAIKPLTADDEYDVDAVCELRGFSNRMGTQQHLKQLLGSELKAYVNAQAMKKSIEERRRCWTLHYSDGAQFHLDLVPALPNSDQQIALLKAAGSSLELAETAIAITDNEHIKYRVMTDDWPRSNPKGYSEWFLRRIAVIFNKRRQAIALNAKASVESIPDYKVRTPLQAAIKILKRHRDIMFAGDRTDAPISIIITTLAAHAYHGEESISAALAGILADMDKYIVVKNGVCFISNPSDPLENFADKWVKHPERKAAFFEWLERARTDFSSARQAVKREDIGQSLASSMGTELVERSLDRRGAKGTRYAAALQAYRRKQHCSRGKSSPQAQMACKLVWEGCDHFRTIHPERVSVGGNLEQRPRA